jgi:hypothetical protein
MHGVDRRVQPELVQQVENDLISIMAGGTAKDVDILSRLLCMCFNSLLCSAY